MDFKEIKTQEEFDARIQDRLKRESEKFQASSKELKEELDSLKVQLAQKDEALSKGKTDYESLQKSVAEKDEKISQYEMAKLKTTIALQHGIPYDLASRLTGKDEAEITADAARLAEFIARPQTAPPLKSTEPKGSEYSNRDAALLKMSKNLTNKGD